MDVLRLAVAAILLATGLFKLLGSCDALLATGQMNWVEDASIAQVRGIAALELLAVTGLVLPPMLDVATFLTPLAAGGVVALMAGAAVVHARLGEHEKLPVNAAIAAAAIIVAVAS